jgi:uncharacterized membrane protein YgdD (TMEM256/DUF423 family)
MNSNALLGWIFIVGAAVGVLASVRMTMRRPNPLLTLGSTLFFLGPLVIGARLVVRSLDQIETLGFFISIGGMLFITIGLLLRRRR